MAEKRRYRLLAGGHLEQDVTKPYIDADEHGNSRTGANMRPLIRYSRGDIIESEVDLCHKFNSPDPTFPKKFEYVHDDTEPALGTPISMDELLRRGISHDALLAAMEKETGQAQTVSAANRPPAKDPVQAAAEAGYGTLHSDQGKYPQQPLPTPVPLKHGGDVFETMSDDELRKHAEEEEITVPAKAKREQLLKAIRAASPAHVG